MINTSRAVKSFPEQQADVIQHRDKTQGLSAEDKEKYFDGQDVGQVLNKIADPNYVDPSKKLRAVGNDKLDKDAFLQLLLTQMKNQDPTNPLKSHEMAAQLAQFTSLEKLTNIDDGISNLTHASTPKKNFEALNFIGKMVSGDSSKITRSREGESHEIRFKLGADAQKVEVKITDQNGDEVRSLSFQNLKKGDNEIVWNGISENGAAAKTGSYTMSIEAIGNNGKPLWAETKFKGRITGINYSAQGPVLLIGNQKIQMADVDEIVDPDVSAYEKTNKKETGEQVTTPENGTKADASKSEEENKVAPPKDKIEHAQVKKQEGRKVSGGNNIDSLAMSQGLINNLKDQGLEEAGM